MNRLHIAWNEIDEATDYIANHVKERKLKIDYIVGIARGGLVLAVFLSHKLNIPLPQYNEMIKGNILLVDDISDTGYTLEKHYSYIKSLNCVNSVITATMHVTLKATFIPDIYYKETNDWIVYPFETDSTSKADYKNDLKR